MANLPKPARLKLIQGNPGGRPIRNSPKPVASLPKPPSYLTAAARREWRETGALLVSQGLLSRGDRQLFARWCTLVARIAEAEAKIAKDGLATVSPKGHTQQHPLISIVNSATKQLLQLSDRLGLSPKSRNALDVDPATGGGEIDAFDSYLASRTRKT